MQYSNYRMSLHYNYIEYLMFLRCWRRPLNFWLLITDEHFLWLSNMVNASFFSCASNKSIESNSIRKHFAATSYWFGNCSVSTFGPMFENATFPAKLPKHRFVFVMRTVQAVPFSMPLAVASGFISIQFGMNFNDFHLILEMLVVRSFFYYHS